MGGCWNADRYTHNDLGLKKYWHIMIQNIKYSSVVLSIKYCSRPSGWHFIAPLNITSPHHSQPPFVSIHMKSIA